MAKPKQRRRSTITLSSRLLCCFGLSPDHPETPQKKTKTKTNNNRITLRFAFLKTNRTSIKTVPLLLDTVPEKPDRELHYWSKPKKSKSKSTPIPEIEIETLLRKEDKPVVQDDKRLSFARRIDAIRAPSPPHHVSSPEPLLVVRANPLPRPSKSVRRRRFDPLVGVSVVMVTLVIMVMWGRVCAILCTSAWLYFLPRLSTTVVDPPGIGALDLGSEEYKKKVVFEGFLHRSKNKNNKNI